MAPECTSESYESGSDRSFSWRQTIQMIAALTLLKISGCTKQSDPPSLKNDVAAIQSTEHPEQRNSEASHLRIQKARAVIGSLKEINTSQEKISSLKVKLYDQSIEKGTIHTENINATDTDVEALLKRLPGVHSVVVHNRGASSAQRIIHLRQIHFVSKELFLRNHKMVSTVKPEHQKEYRDLLYERFLWELRLNQNELRSVLRCLTKHHGLKEAYAEGCTSENREFLLGELSKLKGEMELVEYAKRKLREMNELLKENEVSSSERKELISKLLHERIDQLESAMARTELDYLSFGVICQMYVSGELQTIKPLEDEHIFGKAGKAIDDNLDLDAPGGPLSEEREQAMIEILGQTQGTKLAVLGADHNLSNNTKNIEIYEVTTDYIEKISPARK